MAYTLRPGQPYADQGIRISNGQGAALLSSIQRELENKIRQRGFPAVVTMDEVKSGTGPVRPEAAYAGDPASQSPLQISRGRRHCQRQHSHLPPLGPGTCRRIVK